jgi:hypothetical protein
MTTNIPSILFRCWSSKSAGGLRSGKSRIGVSQHNLTAAELLQESQKHSNLHSDIPTAFVSTTSNFLRALHIAYHKIHNGEDARQIRIAFLTSRTDAQTKIYPARDLAIKSGSSEEEADNFVNEYLFLWNVPDDNVVHVVSVDLVIQRGFALPRLRTGQPFPGLSDLRRAFVYHRDQLAPFERGYSCASDACMFGLRAPVHRIASQMSRWVGDGAYNRTSWEIVDQAIEEAIHDRMTTAAEDLRDQGEVEYLTFEIDCLEDTHDETIMEIGWELQNCQHAGSLQARLRGEDLKIMSYRLRSAYWIETAYQHIGL